MGQVNVKQVESLEDLQNAVGRFYSGWGEAVRDAEQSLQAEERRVGECVARFRRIHEAAVAELRSAKHALSACLVPVRDPQTGAVGYPSCYAEKAAVARAEEKERAAQRDLARAQEWQDILRHAATEYRDFYRRVARTIEERVPEAKRFLERKTSDLRAALTADALPGLGDISAPPPNLPDNGPFSGSTGAAMGAAIGIGLGMAAASALSSAGRAAGMPHSGGSAAQGTSGLGQQAQQTTLPGSSGAAISAGATPAPASSSPASSTSASKPAAAPSAGFAGHIITLPTGQKLHMVSLDQIDFDGSSVQSLADFVGSSDAMRDMVIKWRDEVGPGVLRGQYDDYYYQFDQDRGLVSPYGYKDVFDMFYGGNPITLDRGPGGKYDILNGQHRLFMARSLGISVMPVSFN